MVTWNPRNAYEKSISEQTDQLRSEIKKTLPDLNLFLEPSSRRDGHFHDRTVVAETIDDGIGLTVRWDISSGIDNLMSVPKECSVFVEVTERDQH